MLGLGSQYKTEFGKVLPVPNWLYEHLERWHYLSFLKTRKNMELLKQIRFQALAPEKLDALIELVDQDLGYRLHQAIEAVKCSLSEQTSSQFHFKEAAIDIEKSVARGDFEQWIGAEVSAIAACVDRLLANCNIAAHEIDAVFMTGGSSFVPAIRRIFDSKFPKAADSRRPGVHLGRRGVGVARAGTTKLNARRRRVDTANRYRLLSMQMQINFGGTMAHGK